MVHLPQFFGYELLSELGRGTTGIVFQARDTHFNRLVALKVIEPEPDSDWAVKAQRFFREARSQAAMTSANIVRVYQIGECSGMPFLVREFVEGSTLQTHVADKSLSLPDACKILEIVARAVHHIHERGIIHRNLTPDNVLITADRSPKLIGFGRAKAFMSEDRDNRAVDIQALGTMLQALVDAKLSVPAHHMRLPDDVLEICGKCRQAGSYRAAAALANDLDAIA